MATLLVQTPVRRGQNTFVERWFFAGMAIAMIAISVAGFGPSLVNPAGRRAPVTLLASVHGTVFSVWLLLFLAQALLIAPTFPSGTGGSAACPLLSSRVNGRGCS